MSFCPITGCKPGSRVVVRARGWVLRTATVALALCGAAPTCNPQQYSGAERWLAQAMLRDVTEDVKQHYFDPLALDSGWEARVRATSQEISKAGSMNEALSHIAALLDSLNDSHTYFLPPARPYRHDYGFEMEMIGERCFATRVRPGSDAARKGLKAGDEILTLDGYAPTRGDIWKMKDLFWKLQPQLSLKLAVRPAGGRVRRIEVDASIHQIAAGNDEAGDALFRSRRATESRQDSARPIYVERGNGLLIIRIPVLELSNSELSALVHRMRRHSAVILDLRGDAGGSLTTLQELVGSVFAGKITIGEIVNSRTISPMVAEPRREVFTGKLAVVIDSASTSAAELFARVMQIEGRGLVFGDKSAGRVMAARQYMHQVGLARVVMYGAVVSEGEIRMADGQSLEGNGVVPDRRILPSASDLVSGRDPALAAAAEALEVNLTPEEAGAVFPARWPER